MAETHDKQLKEFKDEFNKEAEKMLRECFPKKVVELNSLLHSDVFQVAYSPLFPRMNKAGVDESCDDVNPIAKKRKLHDGAVLDGVTDGGIQGVSANRQIGEGIRRLKPEIITLVTSCNKMKVWIQLLIPRIEDGNNFGVSIQEEILGEVSRVETDASSFLDHISRYYIARGKLASKLLKYPTVEDYRIAVDELDEKQYVNLRLTLCEMRNIYSSLHDMIMKNLEKIKKPRSSRLETMY
ncbi:proteasome activator complex subunit 3-like [Corticium candelabrum]|uniref:proteasome activator complex subunit 3-like n=1 Tax=Corticium candelabrum TaxID=121492 RepID=UPI002E265AFC|nr:proteasome activator complex subunit 3-like [Corticium candelabrum]